MMSIVAAASPVKARAAMWNFRPTIATARTDCPRFALSGSFAIRRLPLLLEMPQGGPSSKHTPSPEGTGGVGRTDSEHRR